MVFVIISVSCYKKNDVIPTVYVDFTIDLENPYYASLNAFGGAKIISSNSPKSGSFFNSYNGNGIIIFAGVDEFLAYDRTCPYEYITNGSSVAVTIDPSSSLFAVCPKCGTKYALSANGTPASGVGRYPLKNYRANLLSGRYVYISNY